jgi:PD-(D/E)XK endonuclease
MRDQCSDEQLTAAIVASRSWRGVLRSLQLPDHSASRLRSVRSHATRLSIDTSHFTGQRTWSDDELANAVRDATDWYDVLRRLGLSADGSGALTYVRLSATRLALDVAHLSSDPVPTNPLFTAEPSVDNLRVAGSALAASWFMLRGYAVAWPLEPWRYDLLVEAEGGMWRIQVKTTTRTTDVVLACSARHGSRLYRDGEIDAFFVIDQQLDCYLVPFNHVAGRGFMSLRKYRAFRVGTAGNWLETPSAA